MLLYKGIFPIEFVHTCMHRQLYRPMSAIRSLHVTCRVSMSSTIRNSRITEKRFKRQLSCLAGAQSPLSLPQLVGLQQSPGKLHLQTCRFSTAKRLHSDKSSDPQSTVVSNDGNGELVYVGTMARLVRFVKMFSLSTSVVGIALQPMIYNQVADLHWALALGVGGVASFFVFITPLLLHLVSKRYVTHMHWNPQTGQFRAVTYSFLLRELEHRFDAKQVTIPNTPHLFTTILINNGKKPLFIDPNLFLNRQALIHLLKFNEPLEWELPPQEGPSSYWDDTEAPQRSSSAGGTKQESITDQLQDKKQMSNRHN